MKDDETGTPVQLVLVEGTSGIGKTTLAWQLCHKWAKLEHDEDYELVILVRLRKKRAQNATTLEDLLPYDKNATKLKQITSAIEGGEGVLIVIDGFDELSHEQQRQPIYVDLFKGECLAEATVIVTTHPSASSDFKDLCERDIHRELEITGFTDDGIKEFAKSIFKSDAAAVSGFRSYIQNNPPIYSMMYLPLSAVIVAKIYQEDYKTKLKTLSQLFDAFTRLLVRRHILSKHDENSKTKVDPIAFPLTSLDNINKLSHAVASQFHEIARMAYDGICANEYIFRNLGEEFENLELMKKVKRRNLHGQDYYTYVFFHHTLQEYMAAIHIATMLSGKPRLQFEEQDMITRFLAGICQANGYEHGHALLKWLIKFLGDHCLDDRSRAMQLVHCACECPSIMDKLEVPQEHPFIVVEPEVGIDWYAMGYCITHFIDKRWGLHIHATSLRNLEILKKGFKSSPPSGLKYLCISKLDLPFTQVFTTLGEFCQLQHLDVSVDEEDKTAYIYDSDLPAITTFVQSHLTLRVLRLGQIVDNDDANANLHKLVEVAVSGPQMEKLKLHQVDHDNLPQHLCENPIVIC